MNSNDSYWLSNPEQPLEGFDRIIGDERDRARAAHAVGLRDGRGAAGRDRRPARQQVHAPASSRTSCSTTASTPASCGATSSRRSARPRPADDRVERAGRRQRGVPGAARLGPARRPRLGGRDPLPPLREPRARRGAGRGHARPLHDAVRLHRPGEHAARPEHRQPGGRAVVRGRGQRPAQRRHPARRAAARLAVRAARVGEDPDPRRSRRRRRLQRDQRRLDRLGRQRRATATCRTARAS